METQPEVKVSTSSPAGTVEVKMITRSNNMSCYYIMSGTTRFIM